MSTYEQNPEAPMSPDELHRMSRHNLCDTLEGFLSLAKQATTADRLSQLANALRMDKTPFRPNTPNYRTCWQALFDRAKQIGATYHKGAGIRQPFK